MVIGMGDGMFLSLLMSALFLSFCFLPVLQESLVTVYSGLEIFCGLVYLTCSACVFPGYTCWCWRLGKWEDMGKKRWQRISLWSFGDGVEEGKEIAGGLLLQSWGWSWGIGSTGAEGDVSTVSLLVALAGVVFGLAGVPAGVLGWGLIRVLFLNKFKNINLVVLGMRTWQSQKPNKQKN